MLYYMEELICSTQDKSSSDGLDTCVTVTFMNRCTHLTPKQPVVINGSTVVYFGVNCPFNFYRQQHWHWIQLKQLQSVQYLKGMWYLLHIRNFVHYIISIKCLYTICLTNGILHLSLYCYFSLLITVPNIFTLGSQSTEPPHSQLLP